MNSSINISKLKAQSSLLIAHCLLLFIFGCKNNSATDSQGNPDKLIIALYTGSGDIAENHKKTFEDVRKYLSKELNKEVVPIFTNDYTAVIEAIHAKKAHIAYLSPFSYVLAQQKHDITPMVVAGEDGQPKMYRSVIISSAASGIKTIDELKAKSKNLSLCFSDPASTSGHLIPRAFLNLNYLTPDSAFKEVIFAGSHIASVLSVASGKIDIGCTTFEYGINILVKSGQLKKEQVNILWTSDPIVGSPVVVRNDLNKGLQEQIKAAYLNMAQKDSAAFKSYIRSYYVDPSKLSYIAVDDTLYNGIRKIANGIKDLSVVK